ncbi:hypothetical protein [Methylobacterium gnaphalii]|uniref:Uncharacterized protein n=1 Tax=Methylobacterium gnaphalii TaxID=1010610 RepID=A0A512JNB0_9HYPH|nr:hypothetical protein [Methylobacterium gnaphalii]GEP11441.1 hypothetical protein MGN01_32860 [Methylobacterium gnaphalii]GJD70215.1 hypothetical protein MMMDOFMJ_3157 [Methylobacterium gnaphalii]GLS50548.1 hypothetical protein GCM10007885_34000 [Methylobacterium gnaphalii]
MDAHYLPDGQVSVTLLDGEELAHIEGPATLEITPRDGLILWDALRALDVPIAAAPATVLDNPTLSDWRVALTLWGRIDDVTAKVNALVASTTPAEAMLGKVAKERLEYANNVLRAQLLQLKDVFGFSADEVDESLWRAAQVSKGDLSGQWPLPGAA